MEKETWLGRIGAVKSLETAVAQLFQPELFKQQSASSHRQS